MNLDEIREFLATTNENSNVCNVAKELLNLLDHKQNAWKLMRRDRNIWKTRCEHILTLQRYDLEQYEPAVDEANEGEFLMFEDVENTIKDL